VGPPPQRSAAVRTDKTPAASASFNRADAHREATGHALAKGLDSWGMFAVVVIDPETGRRSLQTGLDPENDADIARVSSLTVSSPPDSSSAPAAATSVTGSRPG